MFCKKHPRYSGVRRQPHKVSCWRCRLLYALKRTFGVRVGRPVAHRPKPLAVGAAKAVAAMRETSGL